MNRIFLLLLVLLFSVGDVLAAGRSVAVRGYYRKDGTYVAPYYRTAPNGTTSDNYGTADRRDCAPLVVPELRLQSAPVQRPATQNFTWTDIVRNADGRIKRSESAKRSFMRQTGYPNGRPGYIVDHIVPLKRGGADHPSNMQWQTVEEAKAKDRWE